MFPETPEQVEAFEHRHRKNVKLPDLLTDPIAMLRRGYIMPQANTIETSAENNEGHSMAARQGLKLSADTLQKMKEDRQKAEEAAKLKQNK
jgi:hypothetical protein